MGNRRVVEDGDDDRVLMADGWRAGRVARAVGMAEGEKVDRRGDEGCERANECGMAGRACRTSCMSLPSKTGKAKEQPAPSSDEVNEGAGLAVPRRSVSKPLATLCQPAMTCLCKV